MGDIYAGARIVIIWLGRYYESGDDLLKFKEHIWGFESLEKGTEQSTLKVVDLVHRIIDYRKSNPELSIRTLTETFLAVSNRDWSSIRRLLSRPWFRRLWVLQELFKSKSAIVLCGRCSILWDDLSCACRIVNSVLFALPTGKLRNILGDVQPGKVLMYESHRLNIRRGLQGMLYDLEPIECTDPRDRLFGLLGITRTGDCQKVDYSASMRDVYVDWTWSQIEKSEDLDVLNYCNFSIADGLPAWVSNLECGLNYHHIDTILYLGAIYVDHIAPLDGWTSYAASASVGCEPRISNDFQRLHLSGLLIGNIGVLLNPKRNATRDAEVSKAREIVGRHSLDPQRIFMIRGLEIQIEQHFGTGYLPSHPHLWDDFADVLFRGQRRYKFGEGEIATLGDRYSTWRGLSPVPSYYMEGREDAERRDAYVNPATVHIDLILLNIQIFITSTGRMGLAVQTCGIRVDDEIWVLFGGRTPFLMRKEEGEEECRRLVAPCYLSGFMSGEAIEAWKEGKYKVEEVTIV
ncbi:hypothetical protein BDZ45DRAFT_744319 [Acephala macrosclerotiorum]|nr:hypothetical protein BDZ45DRAFT_744319 [Acephala macrosclerotiorum]